MSEIIRIAIDLLKGAFALHGVSAADDVVIGRQLKRGQVLAFFAKLTPCMVGWPTPRCPVPASPANWMDCSLGAASH